MAADRIAKKIARRLSTTSSPYLSPSTRPPVTSIPTMGNSQTTLQNQVDTSIEKYAEESGLHFFEVNGSPALGIMIFALLIGVALVSCCFLVYRCKSAVVRHLSLRNAMDTLLTRPPWLPSVPNPFGFFSQSSPAAAPPQSASYHTVPTVPPTPVPSTIYRVPQPQPPTQVHVFTAAPPSGSNAAAEEQGVPYGV